MSQTILVDIFERIESFFRRLEIYTGVPLTSAMTDKMVEITVEVLDILATATKEMKQSRASESVLHHALLWFIWFQKNLRRRWRGGRMWRTA